MGRIADRLPALIAERFPQLTRVAPTVDRGCVALVGPPWIGTIEITDDGHEATIFLGMLTHGHFGPWKPPQSAEDAASQSCEQVVDFLDALIHDRVLVWNSGRHGGWRYLDVAGGRDIPNEADGFRWSGRYVS